MQHATLSGSWRGRGGEREGGGIARQTEMDIWIAALACFEFGNESTNVLAFFTHTQRVAGDMPAKREWVTEWVREMGRQWARQRVDATFCWLISLSATSGWLNKCQARAKDKHNQAHTHTHTQTQSEGTLHILHKLHRQLHLWGHAHTCKFKLQMWLSERRLKF